MPTGAGPVKPEHRERWVAPFFPPFGYHTRRERVGPGGLLLSIGLL